MVDGSDPAHAARSAVLAALAHAGPGQPTVGEALAAAAELRRSLDAYLRDLVDLARRAGASWASIGDALGVSAQAAHQRYRDR